MWTTPEKHTKRRETLRNANQHKMTRRAVYKVYEQPTPPPPPPKEAFRIKEPYEILNKTKTLTTTAR